MASRRRDAGALPRPVALVRRVRAAQEFAMARGRPAPEAALLVVLLARGDDGDRWRRDDLEQFVWGGLHQWCADHGVPVPVGLAEALWTWFDHLATSRAFGVGSDPLPVLRATLQTYCGLDGRGRCRRPRGRSRDQRAAPVIPLRSAALGA